MSDRVSEAVLADVQKTAAPPFEPPIPGSWRHTSMRLANEVRRLQGLILRVDARLSPDSCWAFGSNPPWDMDRERKRGVYVCAFCATEWDGHGLPRHYPHCPWPALEAEARAIREEEATIQPGKEHE